MYMGSTMSSLYVRDPFHLDLPAGWTPRDAGPLGVTYICPPIDDDIWYPSGIALMTLPETGMPLESLLRTGVFLITRDLENVAIQKATDQGEAPLRWERLLVHGRLPAPDATDGLSLKVEKRVAVTRPGESILVLALYGETTRIARLEETFETLRRSVRLAS